MASVSEGESPNPPSVVVGRAHLRVFICMAVIRPASRHASLYSCNSSLLSCPSPVLQIYNINTLLRHTHPHGRPTHTADPPTRHTYPHGRPTHTADPPTRHTHARTHMAFISHSLFHTNTHEHV